MTIREHKPVPVRPDWVLGIIPHDPVPERVNQRREGHWRSGVSGFGLLNCIDRERANGVDRKLDFIFVRHKTSLSFTASSLAFSRAATLLSRRRCRGASLYSAAI